MKRLFKFLIPAIFFATQYLFAEISDFQKEIDSYELTNLITQIDSARAPIITEKNIIFTNPTGPRFVGIAFDFENYSVIHSFQNHKFTNVDGNVTASVMIYILDRPADKTNLCYRLIIDGLWTSDPNNPNKIYDSESGISLSKVNIGSKLPVITNSTKENGTQFIYNGKPGQTVRLGGSFTNWDSWIYEMEETSPGFYQLNIPLPSGKYYYNYYLGMKAVTDSTNPEKAYTPEGRTASVIVVQ